MNRKTRGFAASLMIALLMVPVFASAGWHTDEIGWHVSYLAGTGAPQPIAQKDTVYTVVNGASVLDTTAIFTLDAADVIPRGLVAPAVTEVIGNPGVTTAAYLSDTTVVGFLTLQPDSGSTAPAVGNGTITIMIDGKIGGYGPNNSNAIGWSRIDSTVTTIGAVADQSIGIAIRTQGKYGTPLSFSTLRARTIGGTGTMGSCRVFLRWWKNDSSNPHRP